MDNSRAANEGVPPVMVLTIETNTLDGQDVRRYEFTTDNCDQNQLAAFRSQISFLLTLMGRMGP